MSDTSLEIGNLSYKHWVRHLVWILPATFIIPLLQHPIALQYHAQREGAGYFQAIGYARLGIESLTVVTPDESISGLHLHSLLSAPLVELGYVEGGRLISFIAAIATTVVVAQLAFKLTDSHGAILAPLFLWAHPLFVRHSYTFMPESLSIFLTSGAILLTIIYIDTEKKRHYTLILFLISLGIINHLWEIVVLFPISVILLSKKRWLSTAGVVSVGTVVASIVRWISTSTHGSSGPAGSKNILEVGPVFLELEWWTRFVAAHPFDLPVAATLPVAFLALGYWMIEWFSQRNMTSLLIVSWLISGLLIPFGLPGGFPWHRYYLWNLLVPLTITATVISLNVISYISNRVDIEELYLVDSTTAFLLVIILLNISLFEVGLLTSIDTKPALEGPDSDLETAADYQSAVSAGETIRDCGVVRGHEITFVGDWPTRVVFWHSTGTILVYSDVLITNRLRPADEEGGPIFISNVTNSETTATITKSNGDIAVEC